MWLYASYREFSREAAGDAVAKTLTIVAEQTTRPPDLAGTDGPPVIVAAAGEIPQGYPMLEGRHRQSLPRVPGRRRGRIVAGTSEGQESSVRDLDAWLVPWRVGADRTMVVTVKPGTVLVMDVEPWPGPHDERKHGEGGRARDRVLRRAARILDVAPDVFATQPAVGVAYERLEADWNDSSLEEEDPRGELLARHARRLRAVLEDLGARPRAVLRTEHRLLKLQTVRRTDAKTLRWLSAQPGRNTAERAGARQRIKAPKRYETLATLENRVLRAFAALTVRETKSWLEDPGTDANRAAIEAHQLRARRIESVLRDRQVPEARPPVRPNFALRFDPRYREIWRAWLELRAMNTAAELQWMWQHRTFMELLELRAAMKLHEAVRDGRDGGTLSHAPVLKARHPPNQGRYLHDAGIRATFGIVADGTVRAIEYGTADDSRPLGAVASAGSEAAVWWDAQGLRAGREGSVGELPWTAGHAWDAALGSWAARAATRDEPGPR